MDAHIKASELSEVLFRPLKDMGGDLGFEEAGKVLQVSDGVAMIYGLTNAGAGELLEFENGLMGVVMNLEEDNVGAVLLGPTDKVKEGFSVKRTKEIASIAVGVLNPACSHFSAPLEEVICGILKCLAFDSREGYCFTVYLDFAGLGCYCIAVLDLTKCIALV